MGARFKNFVLNELFFLFLAPTLIMVGVVVKGVLFDTWHNDFYKLFMASGALYLALLFIRLISWLAKKIRS